MIKRFELKREQRDSGVCVVRWLGDPELQGWKRDDLWGNGPIPSVRECALFQPAGLLYPALLGLIWRLTSDLMRLAMPVFDGVWMCERQDRPYELVQWEYAIEWEQSDWALRDGGFVAAESLSTTNERFHGAALTPVESWPDLMSVIPIGDQANTLCLFATPPTESANRDLLAALRGEAPPRLESLLQNGDDVFAVITQEDEGLGLSSVLIAGRERLSRSFDAEAAELDERVDGYLAHTAAAKTVDEWCTEVERLTAVPEIEQRSRCQSAPTSSTWK